MLKGLTGATKQSQDLKVLQKTEGLKICRQSKCSGSLALVDALSLQGAVACHAGRLLLRQAKELVKTEGRDSQRLVRKLISLGVNPRAVHSPGREKYVQELLLISEYTKHTDKSPSK